MKGVDISHYQSGLDMARLKESGFEFAIIKINEGSYLFDSSAPGFYMAAKAAGIPVGGYCYSHALTPSAAREEARFLLDRLGGFPMPLGLYLDVETQDQMQLSDGLLKDVVLAWCDTIRAAGYVPGVYGSEYNLWAKCNPDELPDDVIIWVAHYGKSPDVPCDLWQNSDSGSVVGFSGAVDTDVVRSLRFYETVQAPDDSPLSVENAIKQQQAAANLSGLMADKIQQSAQTTDACPIGENCGSADISVELSLLASYLQTKEFQNGFLAFIAGKE